MISHCCYRNSRRVGLVRTASTTVMFKYVLLLCALMFAPLAVSGEISGIWKATEGPVWIEIKLAEGNGTVIRNDKYPERVGSVILKNLKADKSKQHLWHGLIYVEKMGEFKNVEVTAPKQERMITKGKVGFLSKSVEWQRTDKIPVR
ncbi:MAG: hypothetical protein ACI955_000723 [Zhongshania sp.]|jgi:uncharacterized protein (DUF2147 family)